MLEIVRRAGGTVTSAELIAGGARWEDLYRLRDLGVLVEISRGVYRIVDAPATAHPLCDKPAARPPRPGPRWAA